MEDNGLVMSGENLELNLVEMIEVKNHPWFVGCQFHPEFTSKPREGHPLFTGFIKAAIARRDRRSDDAGVGSLEQPLSSNSAAQA
jgi:CTP synthase